MPKVSIVIPSYNSEKYIEPTLDSVINQSIKDIEVIVVDDGSTDRSPEIVRSYGSQVRLVSQQNSGVSKARNRGIKEATAPFVCFLDSDDYWLPGKLEHQLKVFEMMPETGVVYTNFIRWEPDQNSTYPMPDSFKIETSPDEIDQQYSGWIYHLFLLDCWMQTSTTMIRREVLEKCGDFNTNLPCGEDWDLWLRIAREYQIVKLKRATTLYRQHRQQTTRNIRDVDFRSQLLEETAKKWGLRSKNGNCVSRRRFFNQLAEYHAAFGRDHLTNGKLRIALHSFFKAWLCSPLNIKYMAYIPFSILGWRPR